MASAPPSAGAGSGNMASVAAIGAGAQLGGAAMGGKAAKDAARMQAASADKAIALQRQMEAQRKAVYEQKMAQYVAMRNTLASRYGIDIGPLNAASAPASSAPVYEYLSEADAYKKWKTDWMAAHPGASAEDLRRAEREFRGRVTSQELGSNFVGSLEYNPVLAGSSARSASSAAPTGQTLSPGASTWGTRPAATPQSPRLDTTLGGLMVAPPSQSDWNDWARYNLGVRNG